MEVPLPAHPHQPRHGRKHRARGNAQGAGRRCPAERPGRRRGPGALDTHPVRPASRSLQRAPSRGDTRRLCATALRREGGLHAGPAEPGQTPGSIPESGVLQEAEPPPLNGADPSRRRLRRGTARPCRPAARMPDRTRRNPSASWKRSPRRGSALWRRPFAGEVRGPAHPDPEESRTGSPPRGHRGGRRASWGGQDGDWRVSGRGSSSKHPNSGPSPAAPRSMGGPTVDVPRPGQIGAGKHSPNRRLDVAMMQSLVRSGNVDDLVATYGHVIVDECHHVPAVSFERVLSEVKARFVTGLTATPRRRDGLHPILEMQLGPVRFAVDARSQAARRPFEHRLIVRETEFGSSRAIAIDGIQALYANLAGDDPRNRLILDDVTAALADGRSPILLTERKDHLEHLAARLRGIARHVVVLRGGMSPGERRATMATLIAIPDNEPRLILATGRYIGEGFDDARLDTLFLTMPVSWKGTLIQYAGRLHRAHPGKREVRIYDYVDRAVPMLARMFDKRIRGYRAIGYARDMTRESGNSERMVVDDEGELGTFDDLPLSGE